ncbi:MAG: hypothetical protein IPI67_01970 [Myxococcales bacterium]|nr:hypothetical protein [Myxococcales bacterium]
MNRDASVNGESTTMQRAAIDDGIAELDGGLGQEMTVEDLMAEVRGEVGLVAGAAPSS